MGVKIHVPADKVWTFFKENKDRLSEEMVVIAENTDTEYAVYLTEEDGFPLFVVCKGASDSEYEEGAINPSDCEETVKRCCLRYLFPIVVTANETAKEMDGADSDLEDLTMQEMEDTIYEREDELMLAMGDFLQVVFQECNDGADVIDTYGMDLVGEILEDVLMCIAKDYGLPVYRPTFLTDEFGEEIYTEFPYDCEDAEEDLPGELPLE